MVTLLSHIPHEQCLSLQRLPGSDYFPALPPPWFEPLSCSPTPPRPGVLSQLSDQSPCFTLDAFCPPARLILWQWNSGTLCTKMEPKVKKKAPACPKAEAITKALKVKKAALNGVHGHKKKGRSTCHPLHVRQPPRPPHHTPFIPSSHPAAVLPAGLTYCVSPG